MKTKILIGAVSALALMTAGAYAQQVNVAIGDVSVTDGGFNVGSNVGIASSPDGDNTADPVGGGGPDSASASDNSGSGAYATDNGGLDTLFVESTGNSDAMIQNGTGNEGFIVQVSEDDQGNNQAALIQNGTTNIGLIYQQDDFNEAAAIQNGTSNTLVILQSENDPVGTGDNEADQMATAAQYGDNNILVIDQVGDSNSASGVQVGTANVQAILQTSDFGSDIRNTAVSVQVGDNNEGFITQNDLRIEENGPYSAPYLGGGLGILTGFTIDPAQLVAVGGAVDLGGANSAGQLQVGNGNSSAIAQRGDGNLGHSVQISNF